MDSIEHFKELSGIESEEIAREILEQVNGDIQCAVDFIHSSGKPNDSPHRSHRPLPPIPLSGSPPALPPHCPISRSLNFSIIFLRGESKSCFVTKLENVPENFTLGQLKQAFIDRCSSKLTEFASLNGLEVNSETIIFDNHHDQNDDVTLKNLHLPVKNNWTVSLSSQSKPRTRRSTNRQPQISSLSVEYRILLSTNSSRSSNAVVISAPLSETSCAISLGISAPLVALKQRVAEMTCIPTARQYWSLPLGPPTRSTSRLSDLIKDLNSGSVYADRKLRHYSLKPGGTCNLVVRGSEVELLPQPSSSASSSNVSVGRRPKSTRSSHRKKFAFDSDQETEDAINGDDNSDVDNYDDDDGGMVFVSDSASPFSLPLIPATLAYSPQLATENFLHVFLQRYCSDVGSRRPPFAISSFDEALDNSLKTPRVADRKPMFIYLHNDRSVAAHVFCSQFLCSPELCQFLEANLIQIWPWDVTHEANKTPVLRWLEPRFEYLVGEISRMQADHFPLLIMICRLEGSYEVITLLTGHGFTNTRSKLSWSSSLQEELEWQHPNDDFPSLEAALEPQSREEHQLSPPLQTTAAPPGGALVVGDLVSELWQKIIVYQQRLKPEVYAEQQRAERESMRKEQDRAYNESLEQDRLKLEMKQREDQETARREDEIREQEHLARQEARNRQIAGNHALPPEPSVDTPGIATIRFRLPTVLPSPPSYEHLPEADQQPISNGMIVRRFRGEERLCDLKNFMESLGYSVKDFKLITTFPRTDLTTRSDDSVTLAQLQLIPQETLSLERR